MVFDVFKGGNLPEKQKSIAVKLMFQHDDKTLSTEEIDRYIAEIIKKVNEIGAVLR
jgi:phenylalanyl-tRNA synthetase beta subunit